MSISFPFFLIMKLLFYPNDMKINDIRRPRPNDEAT